MYRLNQAHVTQGDKMNFDTSKTLRLDREAIRRPLAPERQTQTTTLWRPVVIYVVLKDMMHAVRRPWSPAIGSLPNSGGGGESKSLVRDHLNPLHTHNIAQRDW